jgi:hypothetical protein
MTNKQQTIFAYPAVFYVTHTLEGKYRNTTPFSKNKTTKASRKKEKVQKIKRSDKKQAINRSKHS